MRNSIFPGDEPELSPGECFPPGELFRQKGEASFPLKVGDSGAEEPGAWDSEPVCLRTLPGQAMGVTWI